MLFVHGVIPTRQPAGCARVHDAAHGGIFIVLSILWGWKIDKIAPDRYDLIGGMVALPGVLIIMYWPRRGPEPEIRRAGRALPGPCNDRESVTRALPARLTMQCPRRGQTGRPWAAGAN